MPMYEYKCRDCGQEFEELVSSHDELPPCPECGKDKTEKLMSACAVKTAGSSGGGMPDMSSMPPMGGGCGSGGG